MSALYAWTTSKTVHLSPECAQIGPKGVARIRVEDVGLKWPCKNCFPELPTTVKRACEVCNPLMLRPCKHNGGVQVEIRPPKRPPMKVWTWPERAVLVPVVGYGA